MQRRVGLRRIEALEISRVSRLVMENTQSAMQRAHTGRASQNEATL